ncbi:probable leucine-rich repeat receptor-like protein kinase At1g35710 [Camellia sinensis]|uniref:probable leucine-rich repeat receptor-like protein kinase At1g35710 n=1 Tax=Camellia sinensis TaxID=4442 RepID=UPI001036BCA0|nr:probable leucine-rich repeat receptor-like protein kinase At1g35710 [Camellia sinensis]
MDKAKLSIDTTPEQLVGLVFPGGARPTLTFSDKELPPKGSAHNKPLYISMECREKWVLVVLIDIGLAINVCPSRIAYAIGLKPTDFVPIAQSLPLILLLMLLLQIENLEKKELNWVGIGCNKASRVTHIDLENYDLRGTLFNFNLSSFLHLVSLEHYNNSIHGTILLNIGSLVRPTNLSLSYNCLLGTIPSEIGMRSSLRELLLYSNNLSGPIPSSIRNLGNLTKLRLTKNKFVGPIPQEVGVLRSLIDLQMSRNNLTGSIPTSIQNLANLTILSLYENQLSGSIPEEVGLLRSLYKLSLTFNNLTGSIPALIENLTYLTILYLYESKLSGFIPQEIGKLLSLNKLDLSTNNLTGSIPTSIRSLADLTILNLYANKLSENIPSSIGNLNKLKQLILLGLIPKSLKVCARLYRLRLDRNELVANISEDFSELCHNLTSLKISNNNIFGRILSELGNATQLDVLDLSSNHLVGEIPHNLGKLHSLFDLTLSDNKLFGNIPLEIGEIPQEIGELHNLESLNLSQNGLSGFIPLTFNDILSLISVDISYNHLEGPLPNSKAVQKASFEAFRDNKALCGNISSLKACPPKMSDGAKGKKNNKFLILVIVLVLARNKVNEPSHGTKENLIEIWSYDGKLVYENIIEATENFSTNHCIGVGGYGTVYKVELQSGQVVAVKKLHNSQDAELVVMKSFTSEIQALTEIRHRNIVKLYELAFTMEANEKCDVYSFRVLTLEVIMGKHPGHLIYSLPSSSSKSNFEGMFFMDILDQRLPTSKN